MDIVSFISQNKELLGLILGPILASGIIQKLKHWFELQDHEWILRSLSIAFSLAASVIPAVLGWISGNPTLIGEHAAVFFTVLELLYQGAKVGKAKLDDFQSAKEEYKAYQARQSTIVPTTTTADPQLEALAAEAVPATTPVAVLPNGAAVEFDG